MRPRTKIRGFLLAPPRFYCTLKVFSKFKNIPFEQNQDIISENLDIDFQEGYF